MLGCTGVPPRDAEEADAEAELERTLAGARGRLPGEETIPFTSRLWLALPFAAGFALIVFLIVELGMLNGLSKRLLMTEDEVTTAESVRRLFELLVLGTCVLLANATVSALALGRLELFWWLSMSRSRSSRHGPPW